MSRVVPKYLAREHRQVDNAYLKFFNDISFRFFFLIQQQIAAIFDQEHV